MEAGLAYGECFIVERKRFLRDCDRVLTPHPRSARDGIEMPFTFLAGKVFHNCIPSHLGPGALAAP